MDLSTITLVILSHNRQHCLKRTLPFYQDLNLEIIVLDNSPVPLDPKFIPTNCKYFNVDAPFAIRCAQAAELVSTPYTIIGADDEIYLPSSLRKMRDFLDMNPDYVAAGGYAMAVWEYGPMIAASWAYERTYKYHNDEAEPLARIQKHTGYGINPLTSFFTCNLTRTWAARDCLLMYGKAPVLATDAISVLTICGAGKSKYLDLVYWIRNWNQSPRSHSGWNRKVFLHEWWADESNKLAADQFASNLQDVYQKFTGSPTFASAWGLVLKSDESLQKRQSGFKSYMRTVSEVRVLKFLKYRIKSFLHPRALPETARQLTQRMTNMGIFVPEEEIRSAASTVASILPYESW